MTKKIISILLLSLTLSASNLSHTLSNQSFTGLINTPNAQVMTEGDLTMHFNNQFDNVLRGYDYNKAYKYQENYIFGAGLFPYFEIQGKLAESPSYLRDLSTSIKFQLPYKHKYLPNIAFGLQDVGSASNFYGNKYIVMDKELSFVRASLGYGVSDASKKNNKRMNGIFGGVEIQTFDWLYLLAEDDSREQFAALRFEMPKSWSSTFKLSTMFSTNLTNDSKPSLTINLTFPLYENRTSYPAGRQKQTKEVKSITPKKLPSLSANPKAKLSNKTLKIKNILSLDEIKRKLAKLGIENITLASKESTIYLAYENGVFLFNDMDAIGIAIGLLTQTEYKQFIIEQKRSKIVVLTLKGDLLKAKNFYNHPNSLNKRLFVNTLQKVAPTNLEIYQTYVKNANDSFLKTKVEIKPLIKTFVGNEFGVFTYKLWLRTQLQTNIYKGIDITAVGDIHIYDSQINNHNYDYFLKLYENSSHIESLMIHANNNLFGGINTLSIGTLEERYMGAIDQYIYNYGNHTFQFKMGYLESFKDGDTYKEFYLGKFNTRTLALTKYSYYHDKLDMLSIINIGKYWNQDLGFDIKFKRYFGDVAVYLTYQQSTPKRTNASFSESTDHYAGLGIEVPLTLRHTPNFKYVQVKGTNAFDYRVQTTVGRKDGTNSITPGGNYDPEIAISSEKYFYNRNRLQLSYIKSHAFRLKESYDKYGENHAKN